MSAAAAARAPGRLRSHAAPLAAIIRRDLTGGSRGAATLAARALAILISGGVVLIAFEMMGSGGGGIEFGGVAAATLLLGLLALAMLMAPAIAVSSLRREREAGMLDLLLLAGIRPATLTLGRIASTFVLLESLLVASLPALAFFWFFRRPSLPQLALCVLALTGHFLALSAVAVAISAWSRHAGTAIALSLLLLGGWSVVLIFGFPFPLPTPSILILDAASGTLLQPWGVQPWHHAAVFGVHAALFLAAWLVATRGLSRRQERVVRDKLRERLDRRPLRLSDRWPLTWLLQRTSAPARPGIQAVFVVPVVLAILPFAFLTWSGLAAAIGLLLLWTGTLTGLALAATSLAPHRERRTLESLLATRLDGMRIVADSARGAILGSAVPACGGIVLAVAAAAGSGLDPGSVVAGAIVMIVSWMLAIACGMVSTLVARTTAQALVLAAGLLIAEPVIGATASAILHETGSLLVGPDAGLSVLALVGAAAFLGTWLVVRGGVRSKPGIALAFLPTLVTASLPAWIEGRVESSGLAVFAALTTVGATLLVLGIRRERHAMAVVGAGLLAACLLMPAAGDEAAAILGGHAWPLLVTGMAMGDPFDDSGLLLGVAHHVVLATGLLLIVLPRIERVLGRAG